MVALVHSSDDRDAETVRWLRGLFLHARDMKRARYDLWVRNYRLIMNRASQSSSQWMPAPRDSEIYPACSSLVAWMTDQEINVDIIPATDPTSQMYQYISRIADDLRDVIYTNWVVESEEAQIKLALWDTLAYGTGIIKSTWNNQLAGGFGNAVFNRADPWAIYVDPHATSFEDCEYVIEARRMSLDEIERRFPDTWRKVTSSSSMGTDALDEKPSLFNETTRMGKANPGTLPQSGQWPGSSSAMGRWAAPNRNANQFEANPGYVVYEFWVKENTYPDSETSDELAPVVGEWRLVVLCNNEILLDCPCSDLWAHAGHPYDRIVFDDIGEFYGVALVDHLAYPQIYINRLLTALQHNAELTGNPIFVEPTNSGLGRIGIINKPGQRLPISGPNALNNRPDWLTPPAMPSQVMDLVSFWIERMENICGLSALQKGVAPTQRNAEGSLNMVQEAAFVRVRSALGSLEIALQSATSKLAELIIDNYNEPRIMPILGGEGEMMAKFFAANHFNVPTSTGSSPLKYLMRIEAGANTPTSRAARMSEADKLFTLGVVDDEYVLQRHRVASYQTMLQRLYEKRAKGILATPGQRQRAR